jgi:hypothetical protein
MNGDFQPLEHFTESVSFFQTRLSMFTTIESKYQGKSLPIAQKLRQRLMFKHICPSREEA